MRILGFSQQWPKLQANEFTTFRFARKDRDWEVGEMVQIVLHPRTKHLAHLGVAEIIAKEPRFMFGSRCNAPLTIGHWFWKERLYCRYGSGHTYPKERLDYQCVSDEEAVVDGFRDYSQMWLFLAEHHGIRRLVEPINKLTLRWVARKK